MRFHKLVLQIKVLEGLNCHLSPAVFPPVVREVSLLASNIPGNFLKLQITASVVTCSTALGL